MSWRPLVYLGRISYALYLVQMTPFMLQIVRPLMRVARPHTALASYVAASVISALLYELVERPGRHGVLRLFARREVPEPMLGQRAAA